MAISPAYRRFDCAVRVRPASAIRLRVRHRRSGAALRGIPEPGRGALIRAAVTETLADKPGISPQTCLVRRASSSSLGVAMDDFWAIFITVAVFAVLFLIVKGVERIER